MSSAHGYHRAVIVLDPKGPEYVRIPAVTCYSVGDIVGNGFHIFISDVHSQYVVAHSIQLTGHRGAKSAQTDHNKVFHSSSTSVRPSAQCGSFKMYGQPIITSAWG